MNLKHLFLAAALVVCTAAPAAFAATQAMAATPKVVLNVAIGDPESAEMGVVGNSFKEYLEQAADGAVEVRLFYGSVLGEDEAVQFHKVQTGKLEMAIGGVSNLAPMCPKISILTLPYLFETPVEALQGTSGKAFEILDGYAREAGLRILAWTYSDFRFITNSKRPITRIEDIRGLRFRVPHSIVQLQTYRAFGAIPSALPWGLTYKALEQDLVDGQDCSYPMLRGMRFMDAGQKYLTEIHYTFLLQPLVIGEKLFSKLSEDLREKIIEAGRHAQHQSFMYLEQMHEVARHDLMAKGLIVSKLADEEKWKARALQVVWPDVADLLGGVEAINAYLRACVLPEWENAIPGLQ